MGVSCGTSRHPTAVVSWTLGNDDLLFMTGEEELYA